MKILDTNSFIEKLDISQIKLDDLENIETDIDYDNAIQYLTQYLSLDFLKQFDSIRFLRSGNIELISKTAKRKDCIGIKCVLYLHSNPICWRLWRPSKWNNEDWDNHPAKMHESDSIGKMINDFCRWINKKVEF